MKRLQHLTSIERAKITILQGEGLSIRKIAKELGRSPSLVGWATATDVVIRAKKTYMPTGFI